MSEYQEVVKLIGDLTDEEVEKFAIFASKMGYTGNKHIPLIVVKKIISMIVNGDDPVKDYDRAMKVLH